MDPDLTDVVRLIELELNNSGSLDNARRLAASLGTPADRIERALQHLAEQRRIFENLEPAPIVGENRRWYYGPPVNSPYWQDYVRRLRSLDWTDGMIERLDAATSRAVDVLDPPGMTSFATRGLVIGRVQSGKTAHFTGVISKAADSGYNLFIVLSGITNSLRLQTQKRLNRDLQSSERPGVWNWLTKQEIFGDFEYQNEANVDLALKGGRHRAIAVIKKQKDVLQRITAWLAQGNAGLIRQCAVLVIDDEADQASLNTGRRMEREEVSKINRLIVHLLSVFPRCAFVGYTATPFANVLTHPDYPENLYPRSFMFPLEPPSDYFGAERVHGRKRVSPDEEDEATDGLPLIRNVPVSELPVLRPAGRSIEGFNFEVTATLREALRYFLMATAARLFREELGSARMDFSTMMIHTSQRVAVHRQCAGAVKRELDSLRREVIAGQLDAWESLWRREMAIIDREALQSRLGEVSFGDLSRRLFAAVDRCKVIVSNSLKDEASNVVFEEKGQIAIVIGGNTLSRGLTLEGLVVSYFVRSANAYDTILQMGRWFGYRPYYEDLPRLWMTAEMHGHFNDLATIEEEFRQQLDDYRALGLTPLEAAMRIRVLPSIRITAANKMRFAIVAEIGYGGARPQTIHFDPSPSWLQDNIRAASDLVRRIGSPTECIGGRTIWRGLDVEEITAFLAQYRVHSRSRELDTALIAKYIAKQNRIDRLKRWNVVVYGLEKEDAELGSLRLSDEITANCINRSRLDDGDAGTIYIKALMSTVDILADSRDLDLGRYKDLKTKELFAKRDDTSTGLLVIYPISRASRPRRQQTGGRKSERLPLALDVHVVGIAMVFPRPAGGVSNDDYVQADLQPIEAASSIETDDEDELDRSVDGQEGVVGV